MTLAPRAGATEGRLFVLGTSGAGKTPLASRVAEVFQVPHVGASEWVRRVFGPSPAGAADRQRHIEAMTKFALDELRRDPEACLAYLERHHDLARACVVEGMRNPLDFVRSFDPRSDVAVFLEHVGGELHRTGFEAGLDVIRAYLHWLCAVGLLDPAALLERRYAEHHALDAIMDETILACRARLPSEPLPTRAAASQAIRGRVHVEIPALALRVKKPLLYGNDPRFEGELVPCRAFAVSSYPGSAPTFQVLVEDGAVFSYVPPSALLAATNATNATSATSVTSAAPELALTDLVYHNCPDGDVAVATFAALAGPVLCFFKHRELWLGGTYRFTLDWYRGNDMLHCVSLDSGQLAFLPSHKIKFGGGEPGFEPYKKLRNEWRV